jgi:hypothetical protein
MVDIIQPLDFLGRMGGPANLPNLIGDASAITAQRDQQAATIDALRSRALFEQSQAAQQIEQQQRAQAYQQALQRAADRVMRVPKDLWLLNANPAMPSYDVDAQIVADIANALPANELQRVIAELNKMVV